MRLRKPSSRVSEASRKGRPKRARTPASPRPRNRPSAAIGPVLRRSGAELYGIGRELVRLPAAAFMRLAEYAGGVVLRVWLYVWPVIVALWKLAKRGLAVAERMLTPARVTLVVAALTAVALAGSQFADYRGVSIGGLTYAGVDGVAPAPQVDVATAGSAHAWLGIPLAVVALGIVASCAAGRWQVARMLIPVGVIVVAISLFVDRPKGLDEGDAAVAYEGARATLLGGFWAQLVSGAVLILLAPVLIRVLGAPGHTHSASEGKRRESRRVRSRRPRRLGRTAEAGR